MMSFSTPIVRVGLRLSTAPLQGGAVHGTMVRMYMLWHTQQPWPGSTRIGGGCNY